MKFVDVNCVGEKVLQIKSLMHKEWISIFDDEEYDDVGTRLNIPVKDFDFNVNSEIILLMK